MSTSTANGKVHAEATDIDRITDLVANVMSMRGELFSRLIDPRRDINAECGFPKGQISPEQYQSLYDEDALAARVVECIAKEAWRKNPLIYESEDDTVTPFEQVFDALCNGLRGEKSWFKPNSDGDGNPFWNTLLNANIQSRISRYGTVVLGFNDTKSGWGLEQPLMPRAYDPANPQNNCRLNWMAALPETLAVVNAWETNRNNPRVGKPISYHVTFVDPTKVVGSSPSITAQSVHWTRVVHVTEGTGVNTNFHVPPIRAVYNEIYGSQKVRGAAPEGYWKSAFPTVIFKTIPQLGGNVKVNPQGIKDQWENLQNSLQKVMVLMGMEAQTVLGNVTDPTPFLDMLTGVICIKLGIPIPVFKGYEIGEQASTNNDKDWLQRLAHYGNNTVTPNYIVPVIDRLIWSGCLPQPKQYCVEWPDLMEASPVEQAQVFSARMTGLSTYANGGVESILPPYDMLTREAGYTDEEATAVLGSTQDALAKAPTPTPATPPAPSINVDDSLPMADEIEWWNDEGDDETALAILLNAFCSTGIGGGVDPTCSPADIKKAIAKMDQSVPNIKEGIGALREHMDKRAKLVEHLKVAEKHASKGGGSSGKTKAGQTPTSAHTAPPTPSHGLPSDHKERVLTEHELWKAGNGISHTTDHMTKEDHKALNHYTGEGYESMNSDLRSGKISPENKTHIERLQKAIDRAPVLDKPAITYRAVGLPPKEMKELMTKMEKAHKLKTPVEMKGFVSTSLDIREAKSFLDSHNQDNPIMEISSKKGLSCHNGEHPEEREFLLNHGSKFKVVGIKSVPMSHGKFQRVIQLEQL